MASKFLYTAALTLVTVAGVTACGGGGGSSGNNSTPSVATATNAAPTVSSAQSVSVTEESPATGFYTLEASDPEGDTITMSLADTADAAAFAFNAATGELSPLRTLDFESPLDDNDDNIYELTFNLEDANGGTTSFSVAVTVDNIRDATGFGLDPTALPSENFELIDWRLDFPRNSDGELTGRQDAPSEQELDAGFTDSEFFFTGADGGLVMRAPVIGATTSENARFTRTEFREMLRRGNTSISTNTNSTTERPNLNNWAFSSQPQDAQDEAGGVDGTLRVTMSVDAVTTTGQDNQIGRTIIGQIHARNDEPLRLYYRKLPGNTHGSIYAQHEIRDGDDITFNIIGSIDDDQPNPDNGFLLGELFTYEIIARGNFIDVIISQDGVELGRTTVDQTESGYDIAADYMYFKAGNYHVNNTADVDEFAEVTIYELLNAHEGYAFSQP